MNIPHASLYWSMTLGRWTRRLVVGPLLVRFGGRIKDSADRKMERKALAPHLSGRLIPRAATTPALDIIQGSVTCAWNAGQKFNWLFVQRGSTMGTPCKPTCEGFPRCRATIDF